MQLPQGLVVREYAFHATGAKTHLGGRKVEGSDGPLSALFSKCRPLLEAAREAGSPPSSSANPAALEARRHPVPSLGYLPPPRLSVPFSRFAGLSSETLRDMANERMADGPKDSGSLVEPAGGLK